jgi:hypothetical protein
MAAARVLAVAVRPFQVYNALLERRPLTTKSLTSGLMYAAGDGFAQYGEHWHAHKDAPEGERPRFAMNWKRLGVFAVYGTVIAGPLYHFWFGWLDTLPTAMWRLRQNRQRLHILRAYAVLKRAGIKVDLNPDAIPDAARFSKYAEKAAKIAADQLIFSSAYTLIFFLGVGMMNGGVERHEAEQRAVAYADVQHELEERVRVKITKPERSLERDLLRLKSRLGGEDEQEAIERLLGVLEEQKRAKAQQVPSWEDVWHATWAHTKDVYVTTYIADCGACLCVVRARQLLLAGLRCVPCCAPCCRPGGARRSGCRDTTAAAPEREGLCLSSSLSPTLPLPPCRLPRPSRAVVWPFLQGARRRRRVALFCRRHRQRVGDCRAPFLTPPLPLLLPLPPTTSSPPQPSTSRTYRCGTRCSTCVTEPPVY